MGAEQFFECEREKQNEEGPNGYGLPRRLTQAGIDCRVVAPALAPKVSGSRGKADRRDARKLAHFLRSGDLTTIWAPDEATEAIRDLERVLEDAIRTAKQAGARLRRLDEDLLECLPGWRRALLVRDLQAFHGIALLSAVGLAAEIGDFRCFPSAGRFMSFVGLVPSERSSGDSRRQGGLTKTGNRHVRRPGGRLMP